MISLWLSKRVSRSVTHNILALYGVYVASFVIPLVTIPYLSRVLGPAGWGEVATAQSLGMYVGYVVEYGFDFSGTREVARFRGDRTRLANVLSGVLAAKVLLMLPVLAVTWVAVLWTSPSAAHSKLVFTGIFLGISYGFNMMWFFQGLERMRLVAGIEIGSKIATTVATFVVVRSVRDGYNLLILSAIVSLIATGITLALAYKEVDFRIANWANTVQTLRMGWTTFIFKCSSGLFSTANVLILSFFAPPAVVGYFSGAEKISRAACGTLSPLSRALFPKISYLARHNLHAAAKTARRVLVVSGGASILMGLGLFFGSGFIVNTFLGVNFRLAIPALQVLSVLPLITTLNYAVAIHWMLPMGLEKPLNFVTLQGGLLNIVLACFLAPSYGQTGMAGSIVVSGLYVFGALCWILHRRRLNLFTGNYTQPNTGEDLAADAVFATGCAEK
ncbi:MAG: polysaccharide biosynthesis protein [Bryobacterales bacterium]|nr:polysaccharide biosynthesis protein [Bryobacterales bacterium]